MDEWVELDLGERQRVGCCCTSLCICPVQERSRDDEKKEIVLSNINIYKTIQNERSSLLREQFAHSYRD